MTIAIDSGALGGRYVRSTTPNTGTSTWSFSVPFAGTYAVWGRVLASSGASDSFFVRVDADAEDVYDVAEGTAGPAWQWTRVNGRNGTSQPATLNPRTFALGAGSHTLRFRARESDTRLDRLIVTNDLAYVPTTGNVVTYSDVPVGHPFYEFIEAVSRNGVASGCGGGRFCPDGATTRAQMAVFLLRAKHGPTFTPPPATGTVFTDVPAVSFAAAWIERLAAEGLTSGCGGGRFCPSAPVGRDQLAPFLLQTRWGTSFLPPPAVGMFVDVPMASGFAPWIEEIFREGITGGCGPSLYCPQTTATRGQIAVMIGAGFGLS
jgi:hypothetical protein